MIKKLDDYLSLLKRLIAKGTPLTADQLESVRTHIGFFQHERLTHELVMLVFALLSVLGILYFAIFPDIPVFCLDVLFLALLIPYIKHYYNLENGVQQLYEVYDELEKLDENAEK